MIILSQRLIVIMLGTTLFACGNKQAGHQAGVPEYAVITIEPSVSKLNNSYPATIKGCQDVEIRPNVSGFITKLCVDEGSVVKKGQTLFVIDPEKNLSYTQVSSPADGVIGKIPYRVGSLVSPSMTTPLTTVSDNSKMFVYFSMNEKDLLKLTRQSNGATQGVLNQMPAVELQLVDGSIYSEKGKIETLSGVIDQTTGSASVRATFPNPNGVLRSGGSGVILLPEESDNAIIIPQKATSEIQDKKFAFVVTDSSVVKTREITILPINDGKNYVVTSGLNIGDRIVVEGVGTSVRDGMSIKAITPAESAAKRQQAVSR